MSKTRRAALARGAGLLAVVFFIVGTIALFTEVVSVRFFDRRLTMRTPWRPYAVGVILLIIRDWLVRRPPTLRAWVSPSRVLARLSADAREPLRLEEQTLFTTPLPWVQRIGRLALVVLGFSALVIALTWPQIRRLDAVADLGDPLFYVWLLARVSRQIVRDPLRLFDGNVFYPERLTLTYSDSSVVPALTSAPLFWMGLHPVVIYNLLLLSGFVLSGVTMFLLVRALTGRTDAAAIAGAIFAVYPYRFEHYPHLTLQMTMWMPLTLWALHRTMAGGQLRDGLATGLTFALQMLSSLYYGLFLALYLVPVGGVLWLARGRPRRPLVSLTAGAALAALLVSPVVGAYAANAANIGERRPAAVRFYSAKGPDYLKPHFRSLVYGHWSKGGRSERQLFPRVMPVALAAIALWPPLSAARIAYTLALVVAVDGSLGMNGGYYPWLYSYLSPYRGLRAPARFSLLVGFTLAVLAGYGVARLVNRWPRYRTPITAALLGLVALEAMPRMPLEDVWRDPPPIYASIDHEPSAVLVEFPLPKARLAYHFDARYMYFSTFHWHPILNGSSGHFPESYEELIKHERDFPSDAAIAYLRTRGVDYLTVHGAFLERDRFDLIVAALDGRTDVSLVTAAPWEGGESRLYQLR